MNIALNGPQCSGKTETGYHLAQKTGMSFVDADKVFEQSYGTIASFVAEHGGPEKGFPVFRRYENKVLEGLCSGDNKILALGGGALAHNQGEEYRKSNVGLVKDFAHVVYLIPSSDLEEAARILVDRKLADANSTGSRPRQSDKDPRDEMLDMLVKRHSLYISSADSIIKTGTKSPEEVADDIMEMVPFLLRN